MKFPANKRLQVEATRRNLACQRVLNILFSGTLLCLISFQSYAQKNFFQISGCVTSADKNPLFRATVYLNNTTIGTTTNSQGIFTLQGVPTGSYDLIVSFIGFKTQVIPIYIQQDKTQMGVCLQREVKTIPEVVINAWNQNANYLHDFEVLFLGSDKNAEKCRILNPEALFFQYDTKGETLLAKANKILEIENNALGYKIYYDLKYFAYDFKERHVVYYGNVKFKNLATKNRRRRMNWQQNRMRAYLSSMRFFMKSLLEKKLSDNGFDVRQLIRPEESDTGSHITETSAINLVSSHTFPYDSIIAFDSDSGRAKLIFGNSVYVLPFYYETPQWYRLFNWKKDLPLSDMTISEAKASFMTITKAAFPPSILTLTKPEVYIDQNGVLINPLGVAIEGGWALMQIADLLPIDYSM